MMDKLISDFTLNIEQAIEIANQSLITPRSKSEIKNVLICGMGGSGIGANIVHQWIYNDIKIPVSFCQDYTIPNFVSENTLVIACSYSGNTEETFAAIKEAKTKQATIVAIASGGDLQSFCQENNYPIIIIPSGNQPRAAIAFSIIQLLHVLKSFELISSNYFNELLRAKTLLENNQDNIKQEALIVAEKLQGKVAVIVAERKYEAVAIRAKQQLNENSKYLAWTSIIPEMNHNELVGWGGGDNRFVALFLETSDVHSQNHKRFVLSKQIIAEKTPHTVSIKAIGSNYIERYVYLIHLLDWVSYYLVGLNKVDAFDIEVINYFKYELSNK
jgi:glucose/mannose-6-phosphate isomerase